MPFLYHNNKDEVRMLDCEGRTYVVPPNKPWNVPMLEGTDIPGQAGQPAYRSFTIPADKMAKYFLSQYPHYGLVELAERLTDQGIQFDLAGAAERSAKSRYDDQTMMLDKYVQSAHEDELNKIPVRPPVPVIQEILDARNLDLQKDFGITPVGYKVSEYAAARDEKMKTLEDDNAAQRKELAEMRKLLERTLQVIEQAPKSPKKPAGEQQF